MYHSNLDEPDISFANITNSTVIKRMYDIFGYNDFLYFSLPTLVSITGNIHFYGNKM